VPPLNPVRQHNITEDLIPVHNLPSSSYDDVQGFGFSRWHLFIYRMHCNSTDGFVGMIEENETVCFRIGIGIWKCLVWLLNAETWTCLVWTDELQGVMDLNLVLYLILFFYTWSYLK
jgi:hypothetical protein